LKENIQLQAGDRVLVETGGGGALAIRERDGRSACRRRRQGYVSRDSARAIYGADKT